MTQGGVTEKGRIVHHYEPWGAAKRLLTERADEVVLSGPAGTGKSRACLEKLHLMALLSPGMRGLMVRKTLASLGSTGLVTWREKVAHEGLANGVLRFFGGSAQEPAQYQYSNGSTVTIGGMDKATKIMSSEYDAIYVQEATELSENDWEALTTRLRNGVVSFQQIFADCNPDRPTHWLKSRSNVGRCLMLHSRHEDNPVLFLSDGSRTAAGESYLGRLDALTGVRRERLFLGRWAAADGLVYDGFDPGVHVVDRFPVPVEWPRLWSVDFGFTNPFVCQFWAQDPDGRLFLYREVYMTQRTVDQHAEAIARLVMWRPSRSASGCWSGSWREPRPKVVVCDHDAEGRVVFERALGVPTKNARKAVSEGVQAVQRRLRKGSDGRPRIFLMRDALVERDASLDLVKRPVCTLDEITGYIWEQAAGDRLKEAPRKQDDHGMDAMRYVVAERDLGLKTRVRFLTY